mmetsp:Transcript_2959/g.5662  ORF Transcript_2959/g.5662 Transcript_2959/m.5662 type:complete len:376 (+) Transcript_2959:1143-2270(+)
MTCTLNSRLVFSSCLLLITSLFFICFMAKTSFVPRWRTRNTLPCEPLPKSLRTSNVLRDTGSLAASPLLMLASDESDPFTGEHELDGAFGRSRLLGLSVTGTDTLFTSLTSSLASAKRSSANTSPSGSPLWALAVCCACRAALASLSSTLMEGSLGGRLPPFRRTNPLLSASPFKSCCCRCVCLVGDPCCGCCATENACFAFRCCSSVCCLPYAAPVMVACLLATASFKVADAVDGAVTEFVPRPEPPNATFPIASHAPVRLQCAERPPPHGVPRRVASPAASPASAGTRSPFGFFFFFAPALPRRHRSIAPPIPTRRTRRSASGAPSLQCTSSLLSSCLALSSLLFSSLLTPLPCALLCAALRCSALLCSALSL